MCSGGVGGEGECLQLRCLLVDLGFFVVLLSFLLFTIVSSK